MRVSLLLKLIISLALLTSVLTLAKAKPHSPDSPQIFPDQVGSFHGQGDYHSNPFETALGQKIVWEDYGVMFDSEWNEYKSESGDRVEAELIKTRSDSAAYALLSTYRIQGQYSKLEDVGTYGIKRPQEIIFYKGPLVFFVHKVSESTRDDVLINFARLLAEPYDKGEGDIPVLVKHLPNWEQAQAQAVYSVTPHALRQASGNRPVLDAVNFEGGTEAVTAQYGQSRMVLVEYTTPQIAGDSDARIQTKIKELRDAGQAVPTAYKRVGNYSVFVFDAPDEQTAEHLIQGVTYEQVVQWLGENPHLLERAQRYYTQFTGGVIMAVLKASGLSVLLCFGIGGLAGWLVFKRRRARAAAAETYSDAGGIVRLNLDEMTAETDSSRLLGKGDI